MSLTAETSATITTIHPGGNATGIVFGELPAVKPEILYEVKAQRGDQLRCKGWKQETILRMLENNMELSEHVENLVVYGGIGKAARNWESYYAIVESLKNLEDDQTLVVAKVT